MCITESIGSVPESKESNKAWRYYVCQHTWHGKAKASSSFLTFRNGSLTLGSQPTQPVILITSLQAFMQITAKETEINEALHIFLTLYKNLTARKSREVINTP